MANKRKYTEVQGWWLYSIKIKSNGKYYIGVSGYKKCSDRFAKNKYETCSLNQYLDEWDSMEKTVLVDNLTKEQAYLYEDNIIRALKMNDLCINDRRSGLVANDKNAYKREFRKNNPEYREQVKQQVKQYQLENKEKISERRKQQRLKKKLEKQQINN